MLRRRYLYLLAFLLIFAASPTHLIAAQTHWSAPTTVGYAGAGMELGILAAWDSEPKEGVPIMAVGLAVGGFSGYMIGHNADQALARGDTLSALHRNAVRLGTVLTGATVGAIIAGIIINPKGPSSLGSDEAIFTTSVLAGSALGAIVQVLLDFKLYPADPHVGFSISPEGRATLGLNYHF